MEVLDKLTDYKSEKLNNIIHDDLQSHSYNYKKFNVYNTNIDVPLQKIWLRMPKVKVFKPIFTNFVSQKKSMPLSVILPQNTIIIKKFYGFIKKLERKIRIIVKNLLNIKKISMKSSLNNKEGFSPIFTMRMQFKKYDENSCDFLFNIYNHNHERVNLNYIDSGSFVSCFIELSEVFIHKGGNFGFNWNILQMKIYPDFDFSTCMFIDEISDEEKEKEIIKEQECYHCLYCPNAFKRTYMCINTKQSSLPPPPPPPPLPIIKTSKISITKTKKEQKTQQQVVFAPTINDILNVKLKSTKINNNTNNINNINNINDDNNNFFPTLDEILEIKNKLKKNDNQSLSSSFDEILNDNEDKDNKQNNDSFDDILDEDTD